jgi:hypothetical protein
MALGDLLFAKFDLRAGLESQVQQMHDEIAGYPANDLLNTGTERLLDYFEDKYRAEVPELSDESGMEFDQTETQVDVRYDPMRLVLDQSRPALVAGTRYEFSVPFTGDAALFNCRASTSSHNPPRAVVKGDRLVFAYERTDHNVEALKAEFDRDLASVKTALGWVASDVTPFNSSLRQTAEQAIEARRARLRANQGVAAALGIPLKRRADTPKTYAAPQVRRKPAVARPTSSSKPYAPEPTLELAEYEHILGIIGDMVTVMEQSPKAFAQM